MSNEREISRQQRDRTDNKNGRRIFRDDTGKDYTTIETATHIHKQRTVSSHVKHRYMLPHKFRSQIDAQSHVQFHTIQSQDIMNSLPIKVQGVQRAQWVRKKARGSANASTDVTKLPNKLIETSITIKKNSPIHPSIHAL